jgi:hypothetical protein
MTSNDLMLLGTVLMLVGGMLPNVVPDEPRPRRWKTVTCRCGKTATMRTRRKARKLLRINHECRELLPT